MNIVNASHVDLPFDETHTEEKPIESTAKKMKKNKNPHDLSSQTNRSKNEK